MKSSRIVLIAIAVIAVLFVFRGCRGYNNLVSLREQVNREWANVENVYQRRADLIPNLVNTVKGYAAHEQGTFIAVTEARAKSTSVTIDAANMTEADMKRFQAAQGEMSSALSRLLAVAENYPDLKASQSFAQLQVTWKDLEDQIASARQAYNTSVTGYNNAVEMFPTNIVATLMDYKTKPLFEAIVPEKENVMAKELFH